MDLNDRQGLHNLIAPIGAKKKKKRVGRGRGSGMGKTSGRGMKGQKARKSGNVRPGFEGGQLPLARRLPKRGFNNKKWATLYVEVNVGRLAERFEAGSTVDPATLVAIGIMRNASQRVKVLGEGELSHALTLKVHKISAGAREKVEKAGGTVEMLEAKAV
jgi:large subunit ribosomal protein L15